MSIAPTTMRTKERPVHVTKATTTVRNVVASWHGRTLKVQSTGELLRALHALEPFEATLYELSPHAPRLLESLRRELRNPRHTSAA